MAGRPSTWTVLAGMLAILLLEGLAGQGTAQTLPMPRPVPGPPAALSLTDLIRISLDQNPNLRQARFNIESAQGRAVQAGLYPNPTVNVILDELGDRTGPGGVNTIPLVTQEIVTGHKLRLSRSVALREVDQATLALLRERYALFTRVRQGYFEVLVAQGRVDLFGRLVTLAAVADKRAQGLLAAGQIGKLDRLLFQIELDRLRAELRAAQRERQAAWPRLTSTVGAPQLPPVPLIGSLAASLPEYDFNQARAFVLEVHPEVRSALVGVERTQLALRRAQVEPIPNITVGAGYVRQNQNRSDDWVFQAAVPVPLFNRNQGNIRAAQAELGFAVEEVNRVRNDLFNRLATAFGRYAAALERIHIYRPRILEAADQTYELTLQRIEVSKEISDILLILQSQRTLQETNVEFIRALGEGWQAASEIAGLLLEEQWPLPFLATCENQPGAEQGKLQGQGLRGHPRPSPGPPP